MQFGIFNVFQLVGALGLFIYGMKVMSEGLQKLGGGQMRYILSAMTKNRFLGVISGFFITAILQSSSATTVMTVSFVNAGLMSLVESAGVMMGANIGTTVTAWIVSQLGFKLNLSAWALPIIAIGMPLLFVKKGRWRFWGQALVGFALLFMGLEALKNAIPDVSSENPVMLFLAQYSELGFLSSVGFVLLGALVTVIVQSSSAAMTLTQTLAISGLIPFPVACAMVLGENIGTTITAELASLVGNVHAKRSARIHSLFNLIGVFWMILALPVFLQGVNWLVEAWYGASPYQDAAQIPTAIAAFHTAFNLCNVLLLIAFVPFLVEMAKRSVKAKDGEDEEFRLQYITSMNVAAPEIGVANAKQEVREFGSLLEKMDHNLNALLFENPKDRSRLLEKIHLREDMTDRMEVEIADFLAKLSEAELSSAGTTRVRSLLSIINDMERIADIIYELSLTNEKIMERKIQTPSSLRKGLTEMYRLISQQIKQMNENLNKRFQDVDIQAALNVEAQINAMRTKLHQDVFKYIESGDLSAQESIYYMNVINSGERIGDHLININEGIIGEK